MIEWIEWTGGEMPVAPGTPVHVRLRFGKEKYGVAGSGYATRWTYGGPQGGHDDILAYRIAEPPAENLKDIEWCVLDLLLRAKRKGVSRVNRLELMRTDTLPDAVKMQLVFTALLMAGGPFVELHGEHDFEITDVGARMFDERMGQPSAIADAVIALPDRSGQVMQ